MVIKVMKSLFVALTPVSQLWLEQVAFKYLNIEKLQKFLVQAQSLVSNTGMCHKCNLCVHVRVREVKVKKKNKSNAQFYETVWFQHLVEKVCTAQWLTSTAELPN